MVRKVRLFRLSIFRLLVINVNVLPLGNDVRELCPVVGIDDAGCLFMSLLSIRKWSNRKD